MAGNPQVLGLLEEMLDSGKTPEEVCRGCPELLPEVRRRWQAFRLIDAQVGALLPGLGEATDAGVGASESPPAGLPQVSGYEVEAVLGHGGMGVVYKARQRALDRWVAVKMLLAGPLAGPENLARFRRETSALGCLRHPNIVQVYDAGEAEGRPYFTMELIEGGSLAQKLAGTPQPTREAAALLATLAEALQVAHQSGIVHRDLKPANIMLTQEGVPKITDFGLARRVEGGVGLTQSGSPVGTPSYMAPEQARGQTRTIGPAVDVYALGAILYELLTGRPPFRGETPTETLLQVIHQEPVPPARLNGKVSRDLETICLKCLEKEPQRRYASAAALADDLTRFGDGRPIQARPIRWAERSWRWCRRNPTAAGLLLAVAAFFLVTAGGALVLGRQQAERRGRAREAIEAALAQIPGLRQQGRWTEARAVLAQASSRLDEAGSHDLTRLLVQAEDSIRLVDALEQIRITPAIDLNRFDFIAMSAEYANAFEQTGLDIWHDEQTVAARIRDSSVRTSLVMALDHWAYVADNLSDQRLMERLLLLASLADPDPEWGDRFRDPTFWRDPSRQIRLATEAQQKFVPGTREKGPPTTLVAMLAKKLGTQNEQTEPMLRAAQRSHPHDFWINYALGEALRERKPAEAVGFYRAALVTRPTIASLHSRLGFALLRQGQFEEAVLAFRKAVELKPDESAYHHNLGRGLQEMGHLDEAMAKYRLTIQLNPKSPDAFSNLGMCLHAKGQIDEAISQVRGAIDLGLDGSNARSVLGRCWLDLGHLDEAIAEFRRAIELAPMESGPHHTIGICLQARGRLDEAIAEFHNAVEIDPKGSPAHFQLGQCFQEKGLLDEAVVEFTQAIELDPRNGSYHDYLIDALLRSGRFIEGRSALRRAMDLLPVKDRMRSELQNKLKLCEWLIALDARLPALLQGKEQPAAEKLVELADKCREYGRPEAAGRLYATAFAALPSLEDDLGSGHRYNAARAAALAAEPHGPAKERLSEPERADQRRQAQTWLRADLQSRIKLLENANGVGSSLAVWQTESDLKSVRDPVELAKLPETERTQWHGLWKDVAEVIAADPLEQGLRSAAHRDWAKATDNYARALTGSATNDGHFWFEYAAVSLLSGDRQRYNQACAHMIQAHRDPKSKGARPRSYHVARACTLAPESPVEVMILGRLAESELKDNTGHFWSLTEQGAIAYRASNFQEAVSLFEQSLRAEPKSGRAILNWLWLALSHHRLGNVQESRRWLEKSQKWLDQYPDGMPPRAEKEFGLHLHNWLEAHVLRREAESLIRPAENH
jgi:serine/threonine-protein kinase